MSNAPYREPAPPSSPIAPRESRKMIWGLAAVVLCPLGAILGLLARRMVPEDGFALGVLLAPAGSMLGTLIVLFVMMRGSGDPNVRVPRWTAALGFGAVALTTVVVTPLALLMGMIPGSPGRPFRIFGRAVRARGRETAGWSHALVPCVSRLTAEMREELADAWGRAALDEHASVASFADLSLELLALGAPSDLLERCHHAALDEIAHARACFGLASAYAGAPRGPGVLPIATTRRRPTYRSVALASALDGCLNEGAAARAARAQLAGERDPVVRGVLERIAEDEERHAALGDAIVRFCTREGGEHTADAVRRALSRAA